jgi:hypothetical protein
MPGLPLQLRGLMAERATDRSVDPVDHGLSDGHRRLLEVGSDGEMAELEKP